MPVNTVIAALVFIAYIAFTAKRSLTYLHALQQEEYDTGRLWSWIWQNKAFDKRLSLALLLLGGLAFFLPAFAVNFLVFASFVAVAYLEKDPRKDSKKKLASTARAQRIFFPTLIVMTLGGAWFFFSGQPWLWILNVQMIPLVMIVVTVLQQPFEDMIQQSYWNEAREKIEDLRPTVIGITGSYGKTSVKHILGHILKAQAPTLLTPGSVNTPMGITRIIREELNETHKYFVVEMGAYGPGSIKRLCALTPPDMGIITAVGHAHYERFKSLETVAKAKFELAQSVLEKNGVTVIHERTLRFPVSQTIHAEQKNKFIVVGESPELDPDKRKDPSHLQKDDLHILRVTQLKTGLDVRLSWKGSTYVFEVPLYGVHHGHNIALAFAAARSLGIEAEEIITALKSLPQIEHRLEVKKQPDNVMLIDDAYNSNPLGFRSALDLLATLSPEQRKVLITPGIVELGNAHDDVHEKLGIYAGEVCDVAVIVTPKRIPTFIKGFKSTGANKTLVEAKTFQEASAWLSKNRQPGDIVLIENDLPDIYERVPRM